MDKYAKAVEEAKQREATGQGRFSMWANHQPWLLFGEIPGLDCCVTYAYNVGCADERVQQIIQSDERLKPIRGGTSSEALSQIPFEVFADIRRKVDPMLEGAQ